MKYAVVIPDGCADEPQPALQGQTPLQAAHVPNMDEVVRRGQVGRSNNTPPQLPSGSDVATMNLFGYDALQFHTGRAPLEAAAMGVQLADHDWAIRCNLVRIQNGCMQSFTAHQIPSTVGAACIAALQSELGNDRLEFVPGISYRNLLVYRDQQGNAPFSSETRTTPPHDITDREVAPALAVGPGSELLRDLMQRSEKILASVPENIARGPHAATSAWLWGQGKRPSLQNFTDRFGVTAAMTTSVDLLRGLATLLGWKNLDVPGVTGYLDNDYSAQAAAALAALQHVDLVVVHVESTDEVSHEGNVAAKVSALERIDAEIVGPLLAGMQAMGDYRLLVSPDHPTFLRTKTHSYGDVPFAMCGSGVSVDSAARYSEATAAASSTVFARGCDLMPYFLGK